MAAEEDVTLPKRQRPFFNGVVLLARGVFHFLALLFGQDFWKLRPAEEKDLAQAITGWVYSRPAKQQTAVIKFFTNVAPSLALLLTVGGIFEIRFRTQAKLMQIRRTLQAQVDRVRAGQAPQPQPQEPSAPPPQTAVPINPSPDAILVPERPDTGPHPMEELQMEGVRESAAA